MAFVECVEHIYTNIYLEAVEYVWKMCLFWVKYVSGSDASQPGNPLFFLVAVWLPLVAVGWFWLCLVAFVIYCVEYVVDYDVEKHLLICKQS